VGVPRHGRRRVGGQPGSGGSGLTTGTRSGRGHHARPERAASDGTLTPHLRRSRSDGRVLRARLVAPRPGPARRAHVVRGPLGHVDGAAARARRPRAHARKALLPCRRGRALRGPRDGVPRSAQDHRRAERAVRHEGRQQRLHRSRAPRPRRGRGEVLVLGSRSRHRPRLAEAAGEPRDPPDAARAARAR